MSFKICTFHSILIFLCRVKSFFIRINILCFNLKLHKPKKDTNVGFKGIATLVIFYFLNLVALTKIQNWYFLNLFATSKIFFYLINKLKLSFSISFFIKLL